MADEVPSGSANITPSPDWLTERGRYEAIDGKVVVEDICRWVLQRSGEVVMWGEGNLAVDFEAMAQNKHDPSAYVLVVGGSVGAIPDREYRFEAPNGGCVGGANGVVSHKATAEASPDIRAYEIKDDDE